MPWSPRRTHEERQADLWRSWQQRFADTSTMPDKVRHALDLLRPERVRAMVTGVEVKLRRRFGFLFA